MNDPSLCIWLLLLFHFFSFDSLDIIKLFGMWFKQTDLRDFLWFLLLNASFISSATRNQFYEIMYFDKNQEYPSMLSINDIEIRIIGRETDTHRWTYYEVIEKMEEKIAFVFKIKISTFLNSCLIDCIWWLTSMPLFLF